MEVQMRRVWRTPRAGSLARLNLCSERMEPLANDRVRVRTRAVGLNFADIFALVGLYSATPSGSFIPGLEISGEISAVGSAVTGFVPGDKVMAVCRFGGYAEFVDLEPIYCRRLPEGWSFAQGAAYLVQTLTAWYALHELGAVKPGYNVLVQSAAGGVGLQAMELCRKIGAFAVGTVSTPEKQDFLAQRGFSHVAVRNKNFATAIKKLLDGRELHIALDAIGGDLQRACYDLLAPCGRLVVFGAARYTPGKKRPHYLKLLLQYFQRPRYDPLSMISDNKSVMGFNLIWLWERAHSLLPLIENIEAMLIEPYVGREFPFSQAPQAIDFLRSGKSIGKVVLTLSA